MVRALCSQLGLGLGLGSGNGIIIFFFPCVKVTKTCVLLVAVQRSDVRPTLRDVMMMYSQDRYMKNLPPSKGHAQTTLINCRDSVATSFQNVFFLS